MKINLAFILSIIVAVGIVAFVFTAVQISSERQKLNNELQSKTVRDAEDFYQSNLRQLEEGDSVRLKKLTGNVMGQYDFSGVAIYYNRDSIVTLSDSIQPLIKPSSDYIARAMAADSSIGNTIKADGKKYYEYIRIVKRQDKPSIAIVFYADAGYIKNIINTIWLGNFVRWFIQALVIAIVTLLMLRW